MNEHFGKADLTTQSWVILWADILYGSSPRMKRFCDIVITYHDGDFYDHENCHSMLFWSRRQDTEEMRSFSCLINNANET